MNDWNNSHMAQDEEETGQEQPSQTAEAVTVPLKNAPYNIHCLTIIGQIEGHNLLPPQTKTTKYEHVIPTLVKIEEDKSVEGLLILLNTVGGDVEAGLAISEMIASMSKPTVSIVLGGGHSIGVPLAVASKHSFIVPSATMTIHPIRTNGTVIGVSQTYDYFSKVQDRVIAFIAKNSNATKERLLQLMLETQAIANDMGTILFGEEAVKEGLIDEVGGLDQAIAKLYQMIDPAQKQNENATDKTDSMPK